MSKSFRLSVMMFLQYAIWGAWLPILFPFLADHRGFSNDQIGTMFAVGAIGALVAPFIAGQIADRFFATERFLAISHLIGAALVWQLASIETFSGFLWFSLAYSLVYAPTLPLTNSIALHHLQDRDRDFGRIRVWGTVGWIVVGIAVGQWLAFNHAPSDLGESELAASLAAGRADAFKISAGIGVLLGVFCFFLPHTPPAQKAGGVAFAKAFGEVATNRALWALFLISIPVSCIHQFYFVHTAGFLGEFQNEGTGKSLSSAINTVFGVGGGGLMTIGQMTEIAVLAAIPFLAKSFSRKTFLLVGLAAYALRMFLFSNVHDLGLDPIVVLICGVALHGLCFGSFIFVAFMIVDEETSTDVRASAQSLYNLVIIGVGIIVGSKVAGWVANWAQGDAEKLSYAIPEHTEKLFSVPMWAGLACFCLALILYPGARAASRSKS